MYNLIIVRFIKFNLFILKFRFIKTTVYIQYVQNVRIN